MTAGDVPAKPHTALRDAAGRLRYEECLTRDGFDGPYTILYHAEPAAHGRRSRPSSTAGSCPEPATTGRAPLARRHYRSQDLRAAGRAAARRARAAAVQRRRRRSRWCTPSGRPGVLRQRRRRRPLLRLRGRRHAAHAARRRRVSATATTSSCRAGLPHRFVLEPTAAVLAVHRVRGRLRLAAAVAQRGRPAAHGRALQPPRFSPARLRAARSTRACAIWWSSAAAPSTAFATSTRRSTSWAGTARSIPWAFPILRFQPRVGQVHLPPTVHGTFAARGALICSFVPRPLDFHPDAIPCPYPHSSVSCDEIIFYCRGQLHLAHGRRPRQHLAPPRRRHARPAPRRLRGAASARRATDELAVMLDTYAPLRATEAARERSRTAAYHASFE